MTNVFEALRSVNAGRAVLALPPISVLPAGHRFALRFNPISRAFEGRLTLLETTVRCDNEELAEGLATAWDMPRGDDGRVELPSAILTFLRSFEDGMLPEFETNQCTVSGCERTATIVRGEAPMCDGCAEEWETVGPLLADARREPPGPITRPVRGMAIRLIFAFANLFRSVASLITFEGFSKLRQRPPKSHKQGSNGSSAAA